MSFNIHSPEQSTGYASYVRQLISFRDGSTVYGDNFEKRPEVFQYGVPDAVRILDSGDIVFRHYTPIIAGFTNIQSQKALIGGTTPYVQLAGRCKTKYPDLTGIFLTTAQFTRRGVGVPNSSYYLDLTLPGDLLLLELEAGIYLIPNVNSYLFGLAQSEKLTRQRYNDYVTSRPSDWRKSDVLRAWASINIVAHGILEA